MDPKLHAKYQKKLMTQFREKCVTDELADIHEFIGPSPVTWGSNKTSSTSLLPRGSDIVLIKDKYNEIRATYLTKRKLQLTRVDQFYEIFSAFCQSTPQVICPHKEYNVGSSGLTSLYLGLYVTVAATRCTIIHKTGWGFYLPLYYRS